MSSFDELLSKLKDKSTQKVIEKVNLEIQQDNTLNDTVDYNESTITMMITLTSAPTRIEKKKQKRKIKKAAIKIIKFLNSPKKDTLITF
jgi:SOS response regulatory protein OraA/RecX